MVRSRPQHSKGYISNTRRNRIRHVPSTPSAKGCSSLLDRYLWQRAGQQLAVSTTFHSPLRSDAKLTICSLADSIAKAGYLVVVPDLFRGDPVPADALSNPASNYSLPDWQKRHPLADIESVIDTSLDSIRTTYNISKIGSVGYCFGGKYVARYLAEGKGIDAGFTAHPSNTQPAEWDAIASPISIAFGDLDQSSTPANRSNIETIFFEGNKTYQTSLYSNAEHGFAVRTNLSVPQKAFAQEGAYFQAVRWLDAWVKGEI
jgi:dienelactone hydrolase